jgi:hypothetical protein
VNVISGFLMLTEADLLSQGFFPGKKMKQVNLVKQ